MSNLPEDYPNRDPMECRVCSRVVGYGEGQCPPGLHGRVRGELKPARSQAELVRTRNSNVLVIFAGSSLMTNLLIALRVFHII
jgi:hypothetical protein